MVDKQRFEDTRDSINVSKNETESTRCATFLKRARLAIAIKKWEESKIVSCSVEQMVNQMQRIPTETLYVCFQETATKIEAKIEEILCD